MDDKLCSSKSRQAISQMKNWSKLLKLKIHIQESSSQKTARGWENPLIVGIWKPCPTLLFSTHLRLSSARDQVPSDAFLVIQYDHSSVFTKSCRLFAGNSFQVYYCYFLYAEPDYPTVPLQPPSASELGGQTLTSRFKSYHNTLKSPVIPNFLHLEQLQSFLTIHN